MNRIFQLIVVFSGVLPLVGHAQGVQFFEGTYAEAMIQAKNENKLVFIDFRADWCKPCIEMEETVFPDSALGAFMSRHFIAMKADVDYFYGMDLKEQFNVNQYPTLLVVNAFEEVQLRLIGFRPADVLQANLSEVVDFQSGSEVPAETPAQNESGTDSSQSKKGCFLFRKR